MGAEKVSGTFYLDRQCLTKPEGQSKPADAAESRWTEKFSRLVSRPSGFARLRGALKEYFQGRREPVISKNREK